MNYEQSTNLEISVLIAAYLCLLCIYTGAGDKPLVVQFAAKTAEELSTAAQYVAP